MHHILRDNMDDIEFTVEAYYHEPGMGFAGKWTTADGDDHYEISYDDSIEDIENNVPQDILDAFNILDDIRDWQESQDEEQEEHDGDEHADLQGRRPLELVRLRWTPDGK